MTSLRVHKLHAAGNDFVVIARPDDPAGRTAFDAIDGDVAVRILDRHQGVGGDTLLLLSPGADGADCRMGQFESDGTPAEMTGNGIRCFAYVADQLGFATGDRLEVDTRAGRRTVELTRDPGTGAMTYGWVSMGDATFEPDAIPVKDGQVEDLVTMFDDVTFTGDAVGIGNPHFVNYVEDVDAVRVDAYGRAMEHDPRFPNRTNVHWVQMVTPEHIKIRTWERGVGPTLACGTGATAAVAAMHRRGFVGARVAVESLGGVLQVEVGSPMRLGGPVVHVFDADLDLDALLGRTTP